MGASIETKNKTGLARLLEIAGEGRNLLLLSSFLSVVSALLLFAPFVATYFIVAELFNNAANPAASDMLLIRTWGLVAFGGLIAALLVFYASSMASHVAAFRILYNLRVRLAEHLAQLPMGYHTRSATGAIKKVVEVSVEKIEGFVAHQIPDLVGAVALPILMLTGMFILDWRLALATAIPVVGAFALQMVVWFMGAGDENFRAYQTTLEEMNAAGVAYVRGMPAVKVFNMTVHSFLTFRDSILAYRDVVMNVTIMSRKPYVLFSVILASILSFIIPVGLFILGRQPDDQQFALTFLLFLVLAPGLSVPVMKLLYLAGNMRLITEGVERIDDILRQKALPEPIQPRQPQGNTIEFDQVIFSYASVNDASTNGANNAPPTLNNISFVAQQGKLTALVGPSGSGKSTIANLILRFWDVDGGSIQIGGVDIREIGTERLLDQVSFVFQDVHLFYDTIAENIRMGNAAASHEEVVAAAKLARCHDFVARLPQGYQTRIGEGGTYLSGGEAQRVAIARAILKNAPILVLDEATAFADPENETYIQQGLSELMKGKTVIIIAHRLSTIRAADQILVIENGQIVERGKHDALLELDGLYTRMWRAHMDAGAWALAGEHNEYSSELFV